MDHILHCHEIVKTDFVRGEGCYLYDSRDRRYIDFEAGIWCLALGYNHPRVNQVIQSQSAKLTHLGTRYPSQLAEEAAQDVLALVGMENGKCTFLSSGSEAVEFGVQAARKLSAKPLLLTFADSYLAAYGSAGKKATSEWVLLDWQKCSDCQGECDPDCPEFARIPFDEVAGFVFEPGNSAGLVRLPPQPLVQTLVEKIKAQGGLVVTNEITTGMGRTGRWFGYQHYPIQPDIVAIGKGLGNGYPVSSVAMSRAVAAGLEALPLRYAQSHQNDPLGCAVAKEVIAVFKEEQVLERSTGTARVFRAELESLAARQPLIKEVRGRGLMVGVEMDAGNDDGATTTTVYRQLLEAGFLVGYNPQANFLRFYPALVIGEEDIRELMDELEQVMKRLRR